MEERFIEETRRLVRAWTQHDRDALRDYLVAGVQDPRVNLQSILARHFLTGRLLPGSFAELMDQELRFAAVVNWYLKLRSDHVPNQQIGRILFHLLADEPDQPDDEAPHAPPFVAETFASLPRQADGLTVPNYIIDLLSDPFEPGDETAGDYHWNALSLPRVGALFESHRADVEAIHVNTLAETRLSCPNLGNHGAYVFVVTM